MRVQSLGWEESPGEGNGNPLQYSCLENPTDRGAWCAAVQCRKKLDTTEMTGYTCTHTEYTSLCYTVGTYCLSIYI